MRILVFSWKDIAHPWAGGSEVNMHEQAKRWVRDGHQVTVFTSRPRGMKRLSKIDGLEIFRAGNRFTVYLLAPFYYMVSLRKRADVVLDIVNGIPFFAPVFSRKPVVGLIHHVHQDMFRVELGHVLGPMGRFVERYLVPILYRRGPFICVSESTASVVRKRLHHGDAMDLRVIHNGIDHDRYAPGSALKSEEPTVLYLGRLKKYKQLPLLISMMTRVRSEVPNSRLLIAGFGDAVLCAKARVKELDAGEYVQFLGGVSEEEKISLYQKSWVNATTSMVEGWGLTVVEANACGTPAVAFDVPGLSESIVNGKTGFVAEDEGEFIDDLVRILSDGSLRKKLSENAINWSAEFNWDLTATKTLAVFEEVTRS